MAKEPSNLEKEKDRKKMASLTRGTGKSSGGTLSSDGRFIDHGDGTITDIRTNLMWTKKDSWNDTGGCMDWNASKSYVSSLNTGGYSNWRLPTVQELKAIFEKSKNNKNFSGDIIHVDPIFASGGTFWHWSSETVSSLFDSSARLVNFDDGYVSKYGQDICVEEGVRAVRSV